MTSDETKEPEAIEEEVIDETTSYEDDDLI